VTVATVTMPTSNVPSTKPHTARPWYPEAEIVRAVIEVSIRESHIPPVAKNLKCEKSQVEELIIFLIVSDMPEP